MAERTNANGSRKFKRLLEEEHWDGLVDMAKEELSGGAHVLDVCVDYVGRNGVADMEVIVGRSSSNKSTRHSCLTQHDA